jgi:nifR3 family TIM-barrel protein
MSYTEFVKVEKILSRSKEPAKRLYYEEAERPITFQIYGDDPDLILKAALRVQQWNPDIIDINMGCPAKSIADRGAGVGLMLAPLKIAHTFKKLTATLKVPVTGKFRLGWDRCKNYKLVARIVEENGGSLIAIHGRTKEQRYSGAADWDAIAEVKSLVKIPVIGSGDVKTVADIQRMKRYTGCDAVMIGAPRSPTRGSSRGWTGNRSRRKNYKRPSMNILPRASNFMVRKMDRDCSASMLCNIYC